MLESEDTRAKSTTWLEARRPDQDSYGNGRFIRIDKMEAEMIKAHATYESATAATSGSSDSASTISPSARLTIEVVVGQGGHSHSETRVHLRQDLGGSEALVLLVSESCAPSIVAHRLLKCG